MRGREGMMLLLLSMAVAAAAEMARSRSSSTLAGELGQVIFYNNGTANAGDKYVDVSMSVRYAGDGTTRPLYIVQADQ